MSTNKQSLWISQTTTILACNSTLRIRLKQWSVH